MRWPLRNQIMLPLLVLLVGTVLGLTAVNAWWAARRSADQIQRQLSDVAETLSASNFPLTNSVLAQMRGLSGAEYVVVDTAGNTLASSMPAESTELVRRQSSATADTVEGSSSGTELDASRLELRDTVQSGSTTYLRAVIPLRRPPRHVARGSWLHVYYPLQTYREAWLEAILPSLLVGSAALLIVPVLGVATAARFVRPIRRMQARVTRIASGDFQPVELPRRDDELRDLGVSVNRMVQLLANYEQEVRRSEQLRTLGQLGGGIAHQLRNSSTGCRMALELHRQQCPLDKEGLDVALEQLTLMEEYIRRFLTLGQSGNPEEGPVRREPVELRQLLESVRRLVAHHARHLDVELRWTTPRQPLWVTGDPDALQQMCINLVLNGIEAAARRHASQPGIASQPGHVSQQATVELILSGDSAEVLIQVRDSGQGPSARVRDELFEPLVTDKPDGVGLGLTVARDAAVRHGGSIQVARQESWTVFSVRLPLPAAGTDATRSDADE